MTEALAPLLIVNPYGLFATTTTTRPVIVIEGSDDNRTWREYALPYLPGPVGRAPTWNIPYQPRLDWQLWFAAYGGAGQQQWIERLLRRLLEGSPVVLALFAEKPFGERPPKHVRALLYDYHFADARSADEQGMVGPPPRRHLLSRRLAESICSTPPAGPAPVRGNHQHTCATQLLETRSVSMIAVSPKA